MNEQPESYLLKYTIYSSFETKQIQQIINTFIVHLAPKLIDEEDLLH